MFKNAQLRESLRLVAGMLHVFIWRMPKERGFALAGAAALPGMLAIPALVRGGRAARKASEKENPTVH